jgi:hypothetical protein
VTKPRKRKRRLQAKAGELIAYYGYDLDGNGPDLCVSWGGEGAERADSRCLIAALAAEVYDKTPFFEILKARGYDMATMKFTITHSGSRT